MSGDLREAATRHDESLYRQMEVPNFSEVELLGGLLRVRWPGPPRNTEEAHRRLQAQAWLSTHPGDEDRVRKARRNWRVVAGILVAPVVVLVWAWIVLSLVNSIRSQLLG